MADLSVTAASVVGVSATAPGTGAQHGWRVTTPFNVYILYKWDVLDGLEKVT